MEQIKDANKQVADADKRQVTIGLVVVRVDDDNEDGSGDDDTEDFRQAVKQQVVDPAGEVESDQTCK